MSQIITSQQFLDDEIVQEKLDASDFSVLLSPIFLIDGEEFQIVLDGHHSLAAAIAAGVDADYDVATSSDHDAVGLLEAGNVEDFLASTHMGDEFINAITRKPVW